MLAKRIAVWSLIVSAFAMVVGGCRSGAEAPDGESKSPHRIEKERASTDEQAVDQAVNRDPVGDVDRRAPVESPATSEEAPQEKLAWERVGEKLTESPVETELVEFLVVKGEASHEGIRNLLLKRREVAMQRRNFEFHQRVTSFYVYAYSSHSQAAQGRADWIAMLSCGTEDEPLISIREGLRRVEGTSPAQTHELSESQRRSIYKEILALEARAAREASERHPSDLRAQMRMEEERHDALKAKLIRKHHISEQVYKQIVLEGLEQRW